MKIAFKPFMTPNFVIAGDGKDNSFPLRMLEADELASLCDAFRAEVFRKSGKADPKVRP